MQTKWKEKRSATGKVKPYFFAALEITALLMCIWMISTFNNIKHCPNIRKSTKY